MFLRSFFILTSFLIMGSSPALLAQGIDELRAEIEANTHIMLRDTVQSKRLDAALAVDSLMKIFLKKPEMFKDTTEIEGISCQVGNDNSFKVYTWQIYHNPNTYRYGGIIQTKEGKIFPLTDKTYEAVPAELVHLSAKNWHGALYYKIMDFTSDGQKMYLLFGYNAMGYANRRKILEVLYFDKTGQPRFGQRVIQAKGGNGKVRWISRLVLDYTANSVVNLNYSPADKMIIFDHLIDFSSGDDGAAPVTDGSYCGLKLVKGKWEYVDMPYEYKYDPNTSWSNPTAPIEKPLFDNKKAQRDIFGRKKRNK